MMAGAVPVKTQQLLDKSLIQKSSARGLMCGKGDYFLFNSIVINSSNVNVHYTSFEINILFGLGAGGLDI
jgi:hypothetical protein